MKSEGIWTFYSESSSKYWNLYHMLQWEKTKVPMAERYINQASSYKNSCTTDHLATGIAWLLIYFMSVLTNSFLNRSIYYIDGSVNSSPTKVINRVIRTFYHSQNFEYDKQFCRPNKQKLYDHYNSNWSGLISDKSRSVEPYHDWQMFVNKCECQAPGALV